MENLVNVIRNLKSERIDFWLSGRFDRKRHEADDAIATWTQLMGRDSAELWLAARQQANN